MQFVTIQDNTNNPYNPSTFKRYAKMQRLVVWAIYSKKKKFPKNLGSLRINRTTSQEEIKNLQKQLPHWKWKIKLLLTTYEKEIKEDKQYMTAYYPTVFRLYNNGGLILVSKKYIEWAKALVVQAYQHINIEKIWQKKNVIMR